MPARCRVARTRLSGSRALMATVPSTTKPYPDRRNPRTQTGEYTPLADRRARARSCGHNCKEQKLALLWRYMAGNSLAERLNHVCNGYSTTVSAPSLAYAHSVTNGWRGLLTKRRRHG